MTTFEEFMQGKPAPKSKRMTIPLFEHLQANNWPDITDAFSVNWKLAHLFGYEKLPNPNRKNGLWHIAQGRKKALLHARIGAIICADAIHAFLKDLASRPPTKLERLPHMKRGPKPKGEAGFKRDRLDTAGWPNLILPNMFYSNYAAAEHFGYEPLRGAFLERKPQFGEKRKGSFSAWQNGEGKFVKLYKKKGYQPTPSEINVFLGLPDNIK